MKLIELPNKLLRERSQEVTLPLNDEDKKIANAMINHIDESRKPGSKLRPGVGIAAVQLGQLKRMIYINMSSGMDGNDFRVFLINPVVVAEGAAPAALEGGEGCLSVNERYRGQEGLVHRKNKIVVKGFDYLTGKEVEITKSGYPAIVLQHELDHLEGKLFIDRIEKKAWEPKPNEVLI